MQQSRKTLYVHKDLPRLPAKVWSWSFLLRLRSISSISPRIKTPIYLGDPILQMHTYCNRSNQNSYRTYWRFPTSGSTGIHQQIKQLHSDSAHTRRLLVFPSRMLACLSTTSSTLHKLHPGEADLRLSSLRSCTYPGLELRWPTPKTAILPENTAICQCHQYISASSIFHFCRPTAGTGKDRMFSALITFLFGILRTGIR